MGPRFIREIRNPRPGCSDPSVARVLHGPRVSDFTYEPRTHRLTYLYHGNARLFKSQRWFFAGGRARASLKPKTCRVLAQWVAILTLLDA